MRFTQRAFEILESSRERDRTARVVQVFLMALIFLNVAAVVIETVEAVAARHGVFFFWFEVLSVAVFTIEYVLRVWSCTEQTPAASRRPLATRLRHMARPMALVDLIAILPYLPRHHLSGQPQIHARLPAAPGAQADSLLARTRYPWQGALQTNGGHWRARC